MAITVTLLQKEKKKIERDIQKKIEKVDKLPERQVVSEIKRCRNALHELNDLIKSHSDKVSETTSLIILHKEIEKINLRSYSKELNLKYLKELNKKLGKKRINIKDLLKFRD